MISTQQNFITIADANYFEPLIFGLKQIHKLHPDARVYVYDWGFSDIQKKKLDSLDFVDRREWVLRLIPQHLSMTKMWLLRKAIGFLRDVLYSFISLKKDFTHPSLDSLSSLYEFEQKIYNKFLVIEEFNLYKKENFVFLDADAFLIKEVPEFFSGEFDFGVTVRPQSEWNLAHNDCRMLNVGVLVFSGGYKNNKSVIDAWAKQLRENTELYCEQTSLTRLLHKLKDDVFKHVQSNQELILNGSNIQVRVLPCETHNFNWIERFDFDKHIDTVKVLHFKSGRFKTPLFKELITKLQIHE